MRVSFHGAPGSYSDLAARHLYPDAQRISCVTFEETLGALAEGRADIAAVPVTNIIAGPVGTTIALLKGGSYRVLAQHWQPVNHCLLALPAAKLEDIRSVHSHWQALAQCKLNIDKNGWTAMEENDTAGAAKLVSEWKDISKAAIASSLAGQEYGLKVLQEGFADKPDNKTLFLAVDVQGNDAAATLNALGL